MKKQQKTYTIAAILLLILGAMVSCQDLNLQPSDPDRAVVKGYLFAGHHPTISISKQLVYGATDTLTTPLEDLSVVIYDSNNNAYPLTHVKNGCYTSDQMVVTVGETYTLKFTYRDKEITSSTTVPEKPTGFYGTSDMEVKPIGSETSGPPSMSRATYYWTNTDSKYFILVVENIEANPTPINDTTEYEAKFVFRQSPTQGAEASLMGRAFSYYGMHNVILYAINKEYVDLYEDSGNTSQNITNPPGNITNGFGIFTAINADTLKLSILP